MKGKYLAIILTVLIFLSINVAFASEIGNETLTLHESSLEESVEATPTDSVENENILTDGDIGSLKDLKDEITSTPTGGELKLERNYEYNPDTDTGSVGIYTSVVIPKSLTIDGQGHTIDGKNAKTIFTISSVSDITLKNIIFKNGYSTGNGGVINGGGAHNLQIINCTFKDSVAPTHGGAIFLSQSNNVVIDSCDFINNAANETFSTRGGAIYWIYPQGGTLTNCNFIKNTAHYGGAVYIEYANGLHQYNNRYNDNIATNFGGDMFCDDSNANLHDCNFTNSHADNYGGSIYWKASNTVMYNLNFNNTSASQAGAIYFAVNSRNTTIRNSNFKNYYATSYAGAIYAGGQDSKILMCDFENGQAPYAGSVYIQNPNISILDSTFKNSTATNGNGGIVYIYGANALINHSTFKNASSTNYGGIVYAAGANARILDSQFEEGYSKYGGAIYLSGDGAVVDNSRFINNLASTYGGAIFTESKNAQINNDYFIGNNATYGSAIFAQVNTWIKKNIVTNINNPTFIHNQAYSTSIDVENVGGKTLKATFRANDNILNAIWLNGDVGYLYFNGVNPENGVENSNNGELVYKDTREYQQTIIIEEFDDSGNLINTETRKTGLYGEVYYTATNGVRVKFTHPEDVFYKGLDNEGYVPSFEIEKVPVTPQVFEGSDIVFEIMVHNNGKIPLTNVVITEDLFEGLTYRDYVKSSFWTYSKTDGVNTWTLTSKLLPDEYVFLNVIFNANARGTLNNTVTVTSDEGISESAHASVESVEDTFDVVKLSLIPITKLGEQTIFEIVVHNRGELDIHNVYVIEDSFEGLIYDHTIRDDLWDYNTVDGKHKWVLKDSLAGHEWAGIFVVFNTTSTGNFTNYAIVGHEGHQKTVNATVWVNETVHAPEVITPGLNITIETIHPLILQGSQTMFEIIVHNTGNVPLTAVTVEEYLYEHLVFDSFIIENDLWDYTPKDIPLASRVDLLSAPVVNDHTWTMNTPLFVNEYLGFFVVFNSTRPGEFSNTVLGSSVQTPDKKPATDNVLVVAPEYTIEKRALVEGEVKVGDEVNFEIIVFNRYSVDIKGIEITEKPDDGLEYVGYADMAGSWIRNGLTWTLNSSIIESFAAFEVTFKVTKAGNLTNTIISGDKTSNDTIFVNETNNSTPVNNTVPENITVLETDFENSTDDEPADEDSIEIPGDEDNGSGTASESIVKAVDSKATGNPVLALFVVLITLVLIRRRNG